MAGIGYSGGSSGSGSGGYETIVFDTATLANFTQDAVAGGAFAQGTGLIQYTANAGGAYAYLRHNTKLPPALGYRISYSVKFPVITGDMRVGVAFGTNNGTFNSFGANYIWVEAGPIASISSESHNTTSLQKLTGVTPPTADTWFNMETLFNGAFIGGTVDLGSGATVNSYTGVFATAAIPHVSLLFLGGAAQVMHVRDFQVEALGA